MHVILRVDRSPPPDASTPTSTYEMEIVPSASLLDCLDLVASNLDPTLGIRDNCFAGVCGDCGMRANGREVLACVTRIDALVPPGAEYSEVSIQPLRHHRVLRDLIVDRRGHFRRIEWAGALFVPGEQRDRLDHSIMESVQQTTSCVNCGLCVSACEAYPADTAFLGPAALAWIARLLRDPRDGGRSSHLAFFDSSLGIGGCTSCGRCDEVCPEQVQPFRQAVLGADELRATP